MGARRAAVTGSTEAFNLTMEEVATSVAAEHAPAGLADEDRGRYNTVAGLIMYLLGDLPITGQTAKLPQLAEDFGKACLVLLLFCVFCYS